MNVLEIGRSDFQCVLVLDGNFRCKPIHHRFHLIERFGEGIIQRTSDIAIAKHIDR